MKNFSRYYAHEIHFDVVIRILDQICKNVKNNRETFLFYKHLSRTNPGSGEIFLILLASWVFNQVVQNQLLNSISETEIQLRIMNSIHSINKEIINNHELKQILRNGNYQQIKINDIFPIYMMFSPISKFYYISYYVSDRYFNIDKMKFSKELKKKKRFQVSNVEIAEFYFLTLTLTGVLGKYEKLQNLIERNSHSINKLLVSQEKRLNILVDSQLMLSVNKNIFHQLVSNRNGYNDKTDSDLVNIYKTSLRNACSDKNKKEKNRLSIIDDLEKEGSINQNMDYKLYEKEENDLNFKKFQLENLNIINNAIDKLSNNNKKVIKMKYIEGMSNKEILDECDHLNTKDSVKTALNKIKSKIKKII